MRFKALQGTGLGFVSAVSSTTGLWLALVPAQCRLLERENKEARGGYFSARGLNLILSEGCGAAAGPVRLFSHHSNSSNAAWVYHFMALPLFSLMGTQIFEIAMSSFSVCRILYGAWTEAVKGTAGVLLSVAPRNEMFSSRVSSERIAASWASWGGRGAARVHGWGGGKGREFVYRATGNSSIWGFWGENNVNEILKQAFD